MNAIDEKDPIGKRVNDLKKDAGAKIQKLKQQMSECFYDNGITETTSKIMKELFEHEIVIMEQFKRFEKFFESVFEEIRKEIKKISEKTSSKQEIGVYGRSWMDNEDENDAFKIVNVSIDEWGLKESSCILYSPEKMFNSKLTFKEHIKHLKLIESHINYIEIGDFLLKLSAYDCNYLFDIVTNALQSLYQMMNEENNQDDLENKHSSLYQ